MSSYRPFSGLLERNDVKNVDFFLVIDFEATCEEKNPPGYPHEIIEFPAVLVSRPSYLNLLLKEVTNASADILAQGILKGEVSLYC